MLDFSGEISSRIEQSDKAIAQFRETQTGTSEAYYRYAHILKAFNRGGVQIDSAPFLEADAAEALLGLVATYAANGIEPTRHTRGHTVGFGDSLKIPRFGHGYKVVRKITERQGEDSAQSTVQSMLVTSDGVVKSADLPYPYGPSEGAAPTVDRHEFLGSEEHYRQEFDTNTIIDSVIRQLASARLNWAGDSWRKEALTPAHCFRASS